MTKQQENKAFAEMIKEFTKAFGRISLRERLILRAAFTYVLEARYEDRNSIVRQLGERCNQLLKDKGDLIDNIAELVQQIEKMKCCGNCANDDKHEFYDDTWHDACGDCENLCNWKLKE